MVAQREGSHTHWKQFPAPVMVQKRPRLFCTLGFLLRLEFSLQKYSKNCLVRVVKGIVSHAAVWRKNDFAKKLQPEHHLVS